MNGWWRSGPGWAVALLLAGAVVVVGGLALVPMGISGGGSMVLATGGGCPGQGDGAGTVAQPLASTTGRDTIPADYLALYQRMGRRYGVPWVLLAGIGTVESDNGQSTLPGVRTGRNAFGAAGPMQIGIGGAAGNTWGGLPVHPAGQHVNGVAADGNGDGIASVYQPADAIAGAAKFLVGHGVQANVNGALFAYNHLESYVQAVLYWAGVYSSGGYVIAGAGPGAGPGVLTASQCLTVAGMDRAPDRAARTAIAYAREQLGKPYQWGGTGPDAFDCSGLVMMAYRAAGIGIPRTSQQQWAWGPRVRRGKVQPGDLVFFAGTDGTPGAPGHVGLVIGGGLMIEAYASGYPIMVAPYAGQHPVGFTRPWAHHPMTRLGSHQVAAGGPQRRPRLLAGVV